MRAARAQATLALIVVAAAHLGGCYASHESVPPGAWAEQLARTVCEVQDGCPNGEGLVRGAGVLTRGDLELCLSHGRGRATLAAMAPWVEAIERGDARIDPVAAAQCLDDVRRATCGVRLWPTSFAAEGFPSTSPFGSGLPGRLGFSAACDATYAREGGRAPGERCDGPLDCAPGAFCGARGEDGARCEAYDAIGAPCGDGSRRVSGACFGPDLACADGRCARVDRRRRASLGQRCGVSVEAGVVLDERCLPGVSCALPGSDDARCVAPGAEGQRCSGFEPCAGPLVCTARMPTEGTCRALTYTTETGATCARHPDGAITTACDPRAGLVCTSEDETAGTCVPE